MLTEHSDWRASAPACRPLPTYSGGTAWDSHPLPGIIGSNTIGWQYSSLWQNRGPGRSAATLT